MCIVISTQNNFRLTSKMKEKVSCSLLTTILEYPRAMLTMLPVDVKYDAEKVSNEDLPNIFRNLSMYGPVLVSCFSVDKHFTQNHQATSTLPCFDGHIDVLSEGKMTHAMVLVGMHLKHGKWQYLLQNFWREMAFPKVSADYLVSSGTMLVWVISEQKDFPTNVPTLEPLYAESFIGGFDVEDANREHKRQA